MDLSLDNDFNVLGRSLLPTAKRSLKILLKAMTRSSRDKVYSSQRMCTQSRSSWVQACVGRSCAAVVTMRLRVGLKGRKWISAFGIVSLRAWGMAVWITNGPIGNRVVSGIGLAQSYREPSAARIYLRVLPCEPSSWTLHPIIVRVRRHQLNMREPYRWSGRFCRHSIPNHFAFLRMDCSSAQATRLSIVRLCIST